MSFYREVNLEPIPPFRLDLTAWALQRRPRNQVDFWDGASYARVLDIRGKYVWVTIRQHGDPSSPRLVIRYVGDDTGQEEQSVAREVSRLLGVNFDLTEFYRFVSSRPRLRRLVDGFQGLHPPCFPTIFEAAVNAICCQQLSLEVGLELVNRLARLAIPKAVSEAAPPLAFPRPEEVANLTEHELVRVGFSQNKARAVLSLARTLTEKPEFFAQICELDDDAARRRLLTLKGIGPWSADYILLRGLGRMTAMPPGDVAAAKSVKRWLDIDPATSSSASAGHYGFPTSWIPFKGLIYFHLLIKNLERRGFISKAEY